MNLIEDSFEATGGLKSQSFGTNKIGSLSVEGVQSWQWRETFTNDLVAHGVDSVLGSDSRSLPDHLSFRTTLVLPWPTFGTGTQSRRRGLCLTAEESTCRSLGDVGKPFTERSHRTVDFKARMKLEIPRPSGRICCDLAILLSIAIVAACFAWRVSTMRWSTWRPDFEAIG